MLQYLGTSSPRSNTGVLPPDLTEGRLQSPEVLRDPQSNTPGSTPWAPFIC